MNTNNMKKAITLVTLPMVAGIAQAGPAYYHAVKDFVSSQGAAPAPRTFTSTNFKNSSDSYTDKNIGVWGNGKLRTSDPDHGTPPTTFGWTDLIKRDVNTSGNKYVVNPDREDGRSPFAAEGQKKGTLREVFGGNNLSRILDGEDQKIRWNVDLFFQPGQFLEVSNNMNTDKIDFTVLERGANSKILWAGITGEKNGQTQYLFGDLANLNNIIIDFSKDYAGNTDFRLNTLEISGSQKVVGTGVNLAQFKNDANVNPFAGKKLVGIALFDISGMYYKGKKYDFDGPDIVDVMAAPVPEPVTMFSMVAGLGALAARRRRNKKS